MKRPVAVLIGIGVLALAHHALAWSLDRMELVERLLSPSLDAAAALPLALALYAIRLGLVFVAPGLAVVAAATLALRALMRAAPAAGSARR